MFDALWWRVGVRLTEAARRLESRILNDSSQIILKILILPCLENCKCEAIRSQGPCESIDHLKISILTKSQPPTPKLRPKNVPNTLSILVNLTRPLHEPFKIKELGLLTHIFRESATRRFLWCNSQLLTSLGRRDMSETVFLPTGRMWLESFEINVQKGVDFTDISNPAPLCSSLS